MNLGHEWKGKKVGGWYPGGILGCPVGSDRINGDRMSGL